MTSRETTTLRRRHDELEAAADTRNSTPVNCSPSLLVVTYTETTYPTTAASYYACHPVDVGGTEGEGESVTTTTDEDQTLYAANVGSAIPPTGTKLLITMTGGRWEAVYNG